MISQTYKIVIDKKDISNPNTVKGYQWGHPILINIMGIKEDIQFSNLKKGKGYRRGSLILKKDKEDIQSKKLLRVSKMISPTYKNGNI